MADTLTYAHGGRLQIPRSRGAASGLLIMILGLWGALAPFVGPYLDFAFSPDRPWMWSAGRGWLEVLPGVVAVLGGFLMLVSHNRATAMLGTWIAVLAGGWFVVGRALAGPLGLGEVGTPVAATEVKQVWLELTYFYGLGASIVFLAALALGRLSVRTARDIAYSDARAHGVAGDQSHPEPAVIESVRETASADEAAVSRAESKGHAVTSDDEHPEPVRHRWALFHRPGHRSDPKLPV